MQGTNYRFVGIDPGAKGYICVISDITACIRFKSLAESPKDVYDFLSGAHPTKILIEKVHSLPKMSAKSNFTFGYNVGGINWLSQLLSCGVDYITPKEWQKKIGLSSGATKKDIAKVAMRLYPHATLYGPRGGLIDGKSDALMIAHCCFLRYR